MNESESNFSDDIKKIIECIDNKIEELNEKHKDFLEENNIDHLKNSIILHHQPSGRISLDRLQHFSDEIDSEIDKILHECGKKYMKEV